MMPGLDRKRRYEMPVIYGPSEIPDITEMKSFKSASVRFVTDRNVLSKFLPEELVLSEAPIVSVTWNGYRQIDYLGGRGYNVARVAAQVSHRSVDTSVAGTFPLVIWESDCNPIILGREISGYPKLFGNIPDLIEGPGTCSFECFEYDACLLSGEITGLQALAGDELSKIQAQGRSSIIFCWKYIPGVAGPPDADYLVKATTSYDATFAARGEGRVNFFAPAWQEAPIGHRILNALRTLPILRYEPAVVMGGSVSFPRSASERLG